MGPTEIGETMEACASLSHYFVLLLCKQFNLMLSQLSKLIIIKREDRKIEKNKDREEGNGC